VTCEGTVNLKTSPLIMVTRVVIVKVKVFEAPLITFEGTTEKLSMVAGIVTLVLMSKPESISLISDASYVTMWNYPMGSVFRGFVTPMITIVVDVPAAMTSCVLMMMMLFVIYLSSQAKVDTVQTPPLRTSVGRRTSSVGT
jgi:hypothetical protein